jgi:hypothetical protein
MKFQNPLNGSRKKVIVIKISQEMPLVSLPPEEENERKEEKEKMNFKTITQVPVTHSYNLSFLEG